MNYKQALNEIIQIIQDRRQLNKDGTIKIYAKNYTAEYKEFILDVLIKLETQDEIIKILELPSHFIAQHRKEISATATIGSYFLIKILKPFDSWLNQYLIKQNSIIEKQNPENLVAIYSVLIDIEKELQLKVDNNKIWIELLPTKNLFSWIFPTTTLSGQELLADKRFKACKYLQKQGILKDVRIPVSNGLKSHISVLVEVSNFYPFIDRVQRLYKRLKPHNNKLENNVYKISYDYVSGIMSKDNKTIKFRVNAFPASLLKMLWQKQEQLSYDQVFEEIQGVDTFTLTSTRRKNARKKFFTTCQRITQKIANELELIDFLVFNEQTVEINPKYLKFIAFPEATKS